MRNGFELTRNLVRALAGTIVLAAMAVPIPAAPTTPPIAPAQISTGSDAGPLVFEASYDFEVIVNGQKETGATVYQSRSIPGVLVISAPLGGAVFTRATDQKVVQVNPTMMQVRNQALILQGREALGGPLVSWSLDGGSAVFSLNGKSVRIQPTPVVLGPHKPDELLEESPSYRPLMSQYVPDAQALAYLKSFSSDVDIEVYFGSWCHVCKQYLPQFLRTITDCSNPKLNVTMIGLPRDFALDKKLRGEKGINGVPCVIVYRGGQEVGRIEGAPRQSYEKDLGALLRLAAGKS